MRTFLLVLVLVAVMLLCGASFLVRAQEAALPGAASMTSDCAATPLQLPEGIDSAVTCAFTIQNTSGMPLADAHVEFGQTPAVRPPDVLFVFRVAQDGVEVPADDFANPAGGPALDGPLHIGHIRSLAPAARSKLVLDLIVRAKAPFAVDAALRTDADAADLARLTLHGEVAAPLPEQPRFSATSLGPGDPAANRRASYALRIDNLANSPLTDVRLDLAPSYRFGVGNPEWRGSPSGHYSSTWRDLGGHQTLSETVDLVSAAGVCLSPRIAVEINALSNANPIILAAVAERPSGCAPQAPTALPATGARDVAVRASLAVPSAVLALWLGVILLHAGVRIRRE